MASEGVSEHVKIIACFDKLEFDDVWWEWAVSDGNFEVCFLGM